jgi:hypothetical protein
MHKVHGRDAPEHTGELRRRRLRESDAEQQ